MASSKINNDIEYEYLLEEEEIVASILQQEMMEANEEATVMVKRQRTIKDHFTSFWESAWGKLLLHPNVDNPTSVEGRRFRRRFRLPYPLFQYLVEICTRLNIFDLTNKSPIPIQLKILACLRILGRDNCADDINELSFELLGESTVHYLFKTFVENIALRVFPKFVKLSTGNQLQKVLDSFAKVGLPGCVGSMDCTRIKWSMCPARQRWSHVGKEGFPTKVYLVIVDHDKRVQYVSSSFKGSCNDVQICQNDPVCLAILNGSLEHVEYDLYNEFGELYHAKGGYILVDGGFVNSIVFQEPEKFRMTRDSVLFAEWMESVRKDVECFFGIIKIRWWWFRNGVCYHSTETLDAAFKTVCTLHNMLLLYDKGDAVAREWETVNWENLDPDADDEVDMEPTIHTNPILPTVVLHELETNSVDDIDNFNLTTTTFTCKMPKAVLKSALQQSFTVQWIKNKLQWPKNMDNKKKFNLPLVRATMEMKRALYKAPSTLLTESNAEINYGLFSKLGYRKDDVIAHFKGKLRTVDEWNNLCAVEPPRRAYGLASSEHGLVLDCYDHYNNGLCIASAANSPFQCINKTTGRPAVANCRLVCPPTRTGQRKIFYLKAGVLFPDESLPKFFIPPGVELLWDYGDTYLDYIQ